MLLQEPLTSRFTLSAIHFHGMKKRMFYIWNNPLELGFLDLHEERNRLRWDMSEALDGIVNMMFYISLIFYMTG